MMPTLPPEVIGTIIEELPWPDHRNQTLKSTSLVCRSLQLVSQKRIFKRIEIHALDVRPNVVQVHNVDRLRNLMSTPRLISYARDISLRLPNAITNWNEWARIYGTSIVALLELIHCDKIQQLTIFQCDFLYQPGTEGGLYERLRTAIHNICDSPSLVSLRMSNGSCNGLHEFKLPSLKVIDITGLGNVDTSTLSNRPKRTTPVIPEALIVDDFGGDPPPDTISVLDYLLDPRSLIDLTRLKHLTSVVTNHHVHNTFVRLKPLLDMCKSSLESLSLTGFVLFVHDLPENLTLNLRQLVNLRELTCCIQEESPTHEHVFVSFLVDQFASANFPPMLERLVLRPECHKSLTDRARTTWTEQFTILGEAISAHRLQNQLCNLKLIEIGLEVDDGAVYDPRDGVMTKIYKYPLRDEVKAAMDHLETFGIIMKYF